jgi:16S rRNA (cytosine967-C5)-methyltransferase
MRVQKTGEKRKLKQRHDEDAPGLAARRLAAAAVIETVKRSRALDETLDRLIGGPEGASLPERDRGLVRAVAGATVRRYGTVRAALDARMNEGIPAKSGEIEGILLTGTAQILFLDVPDHAAVDLAVRAARLDPRGFPFAPLVNAVLRRVARERETILSEADAFLDAPDWLAERWIAAYGRERAERIAAQHRIEAAVDLSVKADPAVWAERLDAHLLPTGSLRLRQRTPIPELPGFAEGMWWVQDAAAALPVRILKPVVGERIVDLCAAPGGKTAQLAAAGAEVLAVDRSAARLRTLQANMERLGLNARVLAADACDVEETGFDAVLLDAPCSATGTLRRHPDVAWTKGPGDVAKLADLQRRLLDKAAIMVRPGGRLVFCTCSLEPEEGEVQIASFLGRNDGFERVPVTAEDVPGLPEAITSEGDLRTLPYMLESEESRLSGIDGFFMARLRRR